MLQWARWFMAVAVLAACMAASAVMAGFWEGPGSPQAGWTWDKSAVLADGEDVVLAEVAAPTEEVAATETVSEVAPTNDGAWGSQVEADSSTDSSTSTLDNITWSTDTNITW